MKKEINGVIIANIENFEKFIRENAKNPDSINMDAYYEELIIKTDECFAFGDDVSYEMPSTETKSGNPENISFDRKYVLDTDGNVISEEYTFGSSRDKNPIEEYCKSAVKEDVSEEQEK